jgi:hypothetical protein
MCDVDQFLNQPGAVFLLGGCPIGEQTADLEVVYIPNGDGGLFTGWATVLCEADTTFP